MSFFLQGPFPLDPLALQGCARFALDAAEAVLRSGSESGLEREASDADEPGLYLLWSNDPDYAIVGFWLVFGPGFLESEAHVGERAPPYARALLDAATEEVWWRNLQVAPREGDTWRPTIILEWPSELAVRSMLAPPGVPIVEEAVDADDVPQEEDGDWLVPDAVEAKPAFLEEVHTEELKAEQPHALPARRSLIAMIRGELIRGRATHTGSFALLPPDSLRPVEGMEMLPIWAWLGDVAKTEPALEEAEHHLHGPAAELFGGRVGFPISGWLAPNLQILPARPADVLVGHLRERDIGSQIGIQVRRAASITVGILGTVILLAAVVYLAAQPSPLAKPPPPDQHPQPAMSLCSAYHQPFIEEFRCQLAAYASTTRLDGSPDLSVCGDLNSGAKVRSIPDDLQADFCGLYDRRLEGRLSPDTNANFAEEAAAQACFNVLGHPYQYNAGTNQHGTRHMADPERFLYNPKLKLRALEDLVSDLVTTCDVNRSKLEHQTEGAIFATHLGAPPPAGADPEKPLEGPAGLRALVTDRATMGMPISIEPCFRAGIDEGPTATVDYMELCGEPEREADPDDPSVINWSILEGEETYELSLVERYTRARFGEGLSLQTDKAPALWTCHLNLIGELQTPDIPSYIQTPWEIAVPVALSYDHSEARVGSQLVLDAGLMAFEEDGLDGLICWSVVERRLARYTPAHPLFDAPDPEGWPSPEQQLCGQICAGRYRVKQPDELRPWVTSDQDLARCLNTSPLPEDERILSNLGGGALDQLRLPWNGARGWESPAAAALCAFNMVAQSQFEDDDNPLVAGDLDPRVWAGETSSGSRIAGGAPAETGNSDASGAAATAADRLQRVGRARSLSTCGYVATQCFTSIMLEITGNKGNEPYQWMRLWERSLDELNRSRTRELDDEPWCQLIQPYLSPDRSLPEGELDYPCAKGVLDTQLAVEATLRSLTTDLYAESDE